MSRPEEASAALSSVTATTAGEEVLQCFWDLASLEEAARTRAAVSLVEKLATSQQTPTHNGSFKKEKGPGSKQQRIDAELRRCSPLVVYAVQRLVKGLGSGRQAARQGFALSLTLLLAEVETVSSEAVLGLIEMWLQPTNSMKGSDVRDVALGRPFAYAALIRSGRVQKEAQLPKKLAALLLESMKYKSFLREASAACLCELLETVSPSELVSILREVEGIEASLNTSLEAATAEDLLLALRLWPHLPPKILKRGALLPKGIEAPPSDFGISNGKSTAAAAAFFSAEHLSKLSAVLKSSSASHPRLHSVWDAIIALLLPGLGSSEAPVGLSGKQLDLFWSAVVGDNVFESTAERKFMCFQLFARLLPHIRPEHVPILVSPRFLRGLAASLSHQDSRMHAAARKTLDDVIEAARKPGDPALRVALAVALQEQTGFGALSGGVTRLLQIMDEQSMRLYIGRIVTDFASSTSSSSRDPITEGNSGTAGSLQPKLSPLETKRHALIEQLAGAASLPNTPLDLLESTTRFLALHAFFSLEQEQDGHDAELRAAACLHPPPSEATRQLCAARLLTVLEKTGRAKAVQNIEHASSDRHVPSRRSENVALKASTAFVSQMRATEGVDFAVELSEPIEAARDGLAKLEHRVSKTLGDTDHKDEADQLLALLQLIRWLQLYVIGDAANVDPGLASELASIFKAAFGKKVKKSNSGTAWMDQLVDICLSLSAYAGADLPSSPLRDAVEAVFRAFAPLLTPTGFQDMIRIISRPDQPAKAAGEDDDSVLEDESEDESESDSENDSEEAAEAEADAGSEGDEDEAGTCQEDEPVAVSEARIGQTITDGEASTSDQDDDEDMTDEQMFKMDKMIAAVLRTQKDAKGDAKRMQQSLQNFKLRILALLDIFSKAAPGSPLVALHAAQLVKATESAEKAGGLKSLAERLRNVVCKLCRSKPQSKTARDIEPATISAGIEAVQLSRGRALKSQVHLRVASEAALRYLFAVAAIADTERHREAAASGMRTMLSHFFKKRSDRMPRSLLQSFMQHPILATDAIAELSGFATTMRASQFSDALSLLDMALLKLSQADAAASEKASKEGVKAALPRLAASSAAVVKGSSFEKAKKHAEVSRNLVGIWQRLSKLFGGRLVEAMPTESLQSLQGACTAAHSSEANPKVAQAAATIGRLAGLQIQVTAPAGPESSHRKQDADVDAPSNGVASTVEARSAPARATGLAKPKAKKSTKKRKRFKENGVQ